MIEQNDKKHECEFSFFMKYVVQQPPAYSETSFLVWKSVRPFVVGHKKADPLTPLHPLCSGDVVPHGDISAKSANPSQSLADYPRQLIVRLSKTKAGTQACIN